MAELFQQGSQVNSLGKGELPFVLMLLTASLWFYFNGDPLKGLAPALLLVIFTAGHPYLVGALLCTLVAYLPDFYGQAAIAVGSLAGGFLLSARRLAKALLL